ncbi:MAG: hypothetical protein JO308_18810, partial [Verrucomicrobia bacterium]|nr:hypothetical protein [Verrucomicrobiota bacterium]
RRMSVEKGVLTRLNGERSHITLPSGQPFRLGKEDGEVIAPRKSPDKSPKIDSPPKAESLASQSETRAVSQTSKALAEEGQGVMSQLGSAVSYANEKLKLYQTKRDSPVLGRLNFAKLIGLRRQMNESGRGAANFKGFASKYGNLMIGADDLNKYIDKDKAKGGDFKARLYTELGKALENEPVDQVRPLINSKSSTYALQCQDLGIGLFALYQSGPRYLMPLGEMVKGVERQDDTKASAAAKEAQDFYSGSRAKFGIAGKLLTDGTFLAKFSKEERSAIYAYGKACLQVSAELRKPDGVDVVGGSYAGKVASNAKGKDKA